MAAITLAKCLLKLDKVSEEMKRISRALGEGGEDELYEAETGAWSARLADVELEVRKRVPEYSVIVAFAQQSQSNIKQPPASHDMQIDDESTTSKQQTSRLKNNRSEDTIELLSEIALRILVLYQRCLFESVLEVKFDAGKLIPLLLRKDTKLATSSTDQHSAISSMQRLRDMHILHLLKHDPHFVWQNKIGECTG
jgi:nucleolar pre-ribosomal-associated protein 1